MSTVEVNGIKLYYELHAPEEAEVLVLSNGILMSTASWAFQTPLISNRYRLLLYDCRGMWQSEHPPGPYTMEQYADDLAGLLDVLEIERTSSIRSCWASWPGSGRDRRGGGDVLGNLMGRPYRET